MEGTINKSYANRVKANVRAPCRNRKQQNSINLHSIPKGYLYIQWRRLKPRSMKVAALQPHRSKSKPIKTKFFCRDIYKATLDYYHAVAIE